MPVSGTNNLRIEIKALFVADFRARLENNFRIAVNEFLENPNKLHSFCFTKGKNRNRDSAIADSQASV